MFQLAEFTQATVNSVTPRVEKHGDDDKPAVSIKLSIEGPNTLLDAIDPNISLALYKPKDDEPTRHRRYRRGVRGGSPGHAGA